MLVAVSSFVEVTLSSKFQVIIPQAIREEMHLVAGDTFRVIRRGDRVEFILVRPIRQMRGCLRGMDTSIEREGDLPNVRFLPKRPVA